MLIYPCRVSFLIISDRGILKVISFVVPWVVMRSKSFWLLWNLKKRAIVDRWLSHCPLLIDSTSFTRQLNYIVLLTTYHIKCEMAINKHDASHLQGIGKIHMSLPTISTACDINIPLARLCCQSGILPRKDATRPRNTKPLEFSLAELVSPSDESFSFFPHIGVAFWLNE